MSEKDAEVKGIRQIKKRDGSIVSFDASKITRAILRAGEETHEFGEASANQLTIRVLQILTVLYQGETPTVEQIQDVVEEVLLQSPFKRTAKAFILYRDQHTKIREMAMQAGVSLVKQYLDRADWQVDENSNMSYSLQGLHNYIASETSKLYWLNAIYPARIKEAHSKGDLHLHDLGVLSVYCVGWDLMDLLISGFQGARGKVQSAPPKHFRSALGQVVNFFYTLQGEAAGAQAFSNIDTLLAPFIRYDNLTYEQLKQAMQEFIFNINVPTRVGFQTPFTNITLDLTPSPLFADQPVIIGGKPQKETYKEFQKEMDLFNRAFLEVMRDGDARGRSFTFPIPTYNMTKDFDWDNPSYRILWEVTGKYGTPYFANFINSDMDPADARSMCCRLRLDNRQLAKRGGGFFGAAPKTGSIGVVTLNLPRLGYLAKDKKDFYDRLDSLMDLAKESLETKRKVIEHFMDVGLYPYSRFYLRDMKKRFGQYWKNHFSTIGLLGLNEACLNLMKQEISTEEGKAFAVDVLTHMRERIMGYQEETGNLYNLEATPAEGTSYRLALLDQKHYPGILTANTCTCESQEPFYTNSSHLPVGYTADAFTALDHQDDLQTQYTGGTVLHLFLGEKISDPMVVKEFVKKVCHNYRLSYFTLTPTFSVCPEHGYQAGEHFTCPKCGADCEVYTRVVGFITPVQHWNKGKKAEYAQRVEYQVPTLVPEGACTGGPNRVCGANA